MSNQLNLFDDAERPDRIGSSTVSYRVATGILTKPSGFMDTYDYSLNPYSGCTFGCTYCYAAFFSRDREKMNNWGHWVEAKENAVSLLKKKRKRPIIDKIVYMSSVTDPYQPLEKRIELTRCLLEEFRDYHDIRLVVQTRSPLVTRDIDIFKGIGRVQVNMTITTDAEEVRKVFEPQCPSNQVRLKAIKEVHDSGIRACITMTPLLPVTNPCQFAFDLKATGVKNFIVQPFHKSKGKFVAGTRDAAIRILEKHGWNDEIYNQTLQIMTEQLPGIAQGKTGFAPPI